MLHFDRPAMTKPPATDPKDSVISPIVVSIELLALVASLISVAAIQLLI